MVRRKAREGSFRWESDKRKLSNLDDKQGFILIVSAYSSDLKRTLGIEAIETSKESEIEPFREAVKKLNLEGVIITGDALHATIKTMETIKDSGNEYILQVKRNRSDWYNECEKYAQKKLQKVDVEILKRIKEESKFER